MIPFALIVDEFFEEEIFSRIRQFALAADWSVEHNPVDNIDYPEVILLQDDVGMKERLQRIMGSHVAIKLMVLRRSRVGTPCPEQAHSDIRIADSTFSAIDSPTMIAT